MAVAAARSYLEMVSPTLSSPFITSSNHHKQQAGSNHGQTERQPQCVEQVDRKMGGRVKVSSDRHLVANRQAGRQPR